jgi:hypothetical protein
VSVVALSEHARKVVGQEREQVQARLEELRAQSQRLRELVDQVNRDADDAARLLRRMDEMLGLAPQLALEFDAELRGRKLQEVAVQFLREQQRPGTTVHYREWYALLLDAGMRVAGKDPLATFLTQVSRAEAVESVRPRSGLYRLRSA